MKHPSPGPRALAGAEHRGHGGRARGALQERISEERLQQRPRARARPHRAARRQLTAPPRQPFLSL